VREVGERILSECDIWFSGGSDSLNATEIGQLQSWTIRPGHFLIGGCDASDRGAACHAVGREVLPITNSDTTSTCRKSYASINRLEGVASSIACGMQHTDEVKIVGTASQLIGEIVGGVPDAVVLQVCISNARRPRAHEHATHPASVLVAPSGAARGAVQPRSASSSPRRLRLASQLY